MKPRVLFGVDVRGWALENNALQLARRLSDEFDTRVVTTSDAEGPCDVLVAMWWHGLKEFRRRANPRRIIVGFCGLDSWVNVPVEDLRRAAVDVDCVYAINEQSADLLADRLGRAVCLCSDGVDLSMFPLLPQPKEFTVGWTGNASRPLKRLGLIREACEIVGVPLVVRDIPAIAQPHEDVLSFYEQISMYVCASESEGTPLPVLEALSCGRPVVSTYVGVLPELPSTGAVLTVTEELLMEDLVTAIRLNQQHVKYSELITACRETVEQRSWDCVLPSWRQMIRQVVEL